MTIGHPRQRAAARGLGIAAESLNEVDAGRGVVEREKTQERLRVLGEAEQIVAGEVGVVARAAGEREAAGPPGPHVEEKFGRRIVARLG